MQLSVFLSLSLALLQHQNGDARYVSVRASTGTTQISAILWVLGPRQAVHTWTVEQLMTEWLIPDL